MNFGKILRNGICYRNILCKPVINLQFELSLKRKKNEERDKKKLWQEDKYRDTQNMCTHYKKSQREGYEYGKGNIANDAAL